jgi:hypothetical protein
MGCWCGTGRVTAVVERAAAATEREAGSVRLGETDGGSHWLFVVWVARLRSRTVSGRWVGVSVPATCPLALLLKSRGG